MDLTSFISPDCVVLDMDAQNKHDALTELTHLLFETKKLKGLGPALDQIMAREMTESTGIGRGIAVPHARVPGMKKLECAVGRVSDGLDFQAVDRNPVHVIFLICYPPTQQTTYLNFVATVAKLLSDRQHLSGVLNAETSEEVCEILADASQTFTEMNEQHPRKLKTEPGIEQIDDAHADVILLARLQLCQEMLQAARTGKTQIKKRIENIRSLVEPRILKHYDRVAKSRAPALVPVEGDTCQGCFMRLSSKVAQEVRQDTDHIHTCPNCSRYIYVV